MVDGLGEGLAFALGWVRNPRRVGAIAPASRALAQAMADEVSRVAPDRLVEVGAGTGAITQALARLQLGRERFQVVERDPGFVRRLHERFPQAEVVHGCATRLDRLATDPKTSLVIVSSLPLMSMPREETQACVQAMHSLLEHHAGARLLQYTYAARHVRPFDAPPGWHWRRVTTVWANLPPATVWSLEAVARFSTGLH